MATPSGTPVDGQSLMVRMKETTAHAITWTTVSSGSFLSSGVATLPTTTVAAKTITLGFKYDSAQARFILLAVDATGY
jgi:hypothetical protein